MSLKTSTGVRNGILTTSSLKALLDTGKLYIYGGAIPAAADDSIGSATLLLTVSLSSGGTGITFATPAVAGVLSKNAGETWSGVVATGGTATFFRWKMTGDTDALSTTALRLQGIVAAVGGDINLTSTLLVAAATQTIDFFQIGQPTA
jgi:hypothetical protein